MRITLQKDLTLLARLEKKFNRLMEEGEYDAAYGVSLAISQQMRKAADEIERLISEQLKIGVLNRALEE